MCLGLDVGVGGGESRVDRFCGLECLRWRRSRITSVVEVRLAVPGM